MNYLNHILLAIFICLVCVSSAASESQVKKITVYVTVDWEGWSLEDENLETMREFRKKYPHIPILQLLNPVYLLRANVDIPTETQKIQSTFLASDAYGLHVHAWKSLIDHCGIAYKSAPSYAGEKEVCIGGECGYTVSLEYAYSQNELSKLIGCSADLMDKQGFGRPKHFRAGGWQLGHKLAAALERNGMTWDSSRTDANLLTTRWAENSGIVRMLRELHPDSTPMDQPYPLTAHLVEYPNNGSLADYTSTQQLLAIFRQLIANNKGVLVLGFHQETAASYLYHLEEAIPLFEQEAQAAGVKLEWASYR